MIKTFLFLSVLSVAKRRFQRCWTFYGLSIGDLLQIHTKGDWTFEDQLILTCIIADEKDLLADYFLFIWAWPKKPAIQLSRQTKVRVLKSLGKQSSLPNRTYHTAFIHFPIILSSKSRCLHYFQSRLLKHAQSTFYTAFKSQAARFLNIF